MKVSEMNDKDKELLRNRLKERRLFLGMTYQELADKTGISKSSLQRYETGSIKNLSYDKIYKLAEALEVSIQYFADLSNDYTGELKPTFTHSHRHEYLQRITNFQNRALKNISPFLISNGYSVEQNTRGQLGDLVAKKGNKIWHIDFLYISDINKYPHRIVASKQQFMLRLGRLAIYNKSIDKYSIVMESREIAEQYLKFNPIHLNVEISIIILKEDDFEELFFQI